MADIRRTPTAPRANPAAKLQQSMADRLRAAREKAQANRSSNTFASADVKERWFQEQTELWLHGVAPLQGKFREQLGLQISEGSAGGDVCTLALNKSPFRDEYYGDLAEIIRHERGPIGPFHLAAQELSQGTSYDLEEVPF